MDVLYSAVLELWMHCNCRRSCFLTTGSATELKHMDPNLALQQLPTVFITKTAQLQGRKANPKLTTATEPGREGRKM